MSRTAYEWFVVINPNDKNKIIKEKIVIRALEKIDKYYYYHIRKKSLIGHYKVDGKFYFGKEKIQSETQKNDFFDIIK